MMWPPSGGALDPRVRAASRRTLAKRLHKLCDLLRSIRAAIATIIRRTARPDHTRQHGHYKTIQHSLPTINHKQKSLTKCPPT